MNILALGLGRDIYWELQELGCSITFFLHSDDLIESDCHNFSNIIALSSECSPKAWADLAQSMDSYLKFDEVLIFNEKCYPHYLAVSQRLNKGFLNSDQLRYTTDKLITRQLLSKESIGENIWIFELSNSEQLIKLLDLDPPYPIIVKPRFGRGSRNIIKLSTKDELALRSDELNSLIKEQPFIAEEYIGGEEYSIEGISHNGTHIVAGVTKKYVDKDSHIETGHVFPAPDLDDDDSSFIKSFSSNLLNALGFENGLSHSEIKYDKSRNKITLIETHLRSGGGSINELVEISTGTNLKDIFCRQLIGEDIDINALDFTPKRYSAVRFLFSEKEGYVDSFETPKCSELIIKTETDLVLGRYISKTSSSISRIASAIAASSEPLEAISAAQDWVDAVQFNVVSER